MGKIKEIEKLKSYSTFRIIQFLLMNKKNKILESLKENFWREKNMLEKMVNF